MSSAPIVLVRDLASPVAAPCWPHGCVRLTFTVRNAPAAHAILTEAYANGFGEVGAFADWYRDLVRDEEYDPELCFLYGSVSEPAAFAQVWTSGFIKDIAVANAFRRQGIGHALMLTILAELRSRGFDQVRLKVHAGNKGAIALYGSVGMRKG